MKYEQKIKIREEAVSTLGQKILSVSDVCSSSPSDNRDTEEEHLIYPSQQEKFSEIFSNFVDKDSLIEIYKERVRDLLSEVKNARVLRVREHPTTGPYVDDM
ncbi:Kinesin-like protein KIF1B [Armadillidium nasatum]|uniref:Kinesin-like protein KIF1B n=1 Tax=Armadillidium nasatum TaxID=96803 RepID=A0A5N5SZY0_9CRUS|nr:Kinesin-like protein KIF1B [Armadillidium nasatum]